MLGALACGTSASRADEPVKLALATTATTFTTAITHTNKSAPKVSSVASNSLSLSIKQPAVNPSLPANPALRLVDDFPSTGPVTVVLQKKAESGGFFSGQGGNGTFGFANIQAGYGQAYDCDSVILRGRNGTASEETRYVFFKKIVKF